MGVDSIKKEFACSHDKIQFITDIELTNKSLLDSHQGWLEAFIKEQIFNHLRLDVGYDRAGNPASVVLCYDGEEISHYWL